MNKFINAKCFCFLILFVFVNISILYFYYTPKEIENYYDIIYIKPIEIDCDKLRNETSNMTLFKNAENWSFNKSEVSDDVLYQNVRMNCSKFLLDKSYILNYANKIEKTFYSL